MNNPNILWARDVLHEKGYEVQPNTPDVIQDNPWAVVYRFRTNQGFFFLKCVPLKLSLEPKIIRILRSTFQANVPLILAENQEQNCFLMEDAGIQLHEFFKQNFKPEILIQTMNAYSTLQITTEDKTQVFFDMGVPDWRLEILPKLYQGLISEEAMLLDDGLTAKEFIKFKKLAPKFSFMCEKLADFKIKDTFGHADFHDKNICINPQTNQTTLIDLGEVTITHPFFSFLNCLYRANENFSLTENQYHQLQIDCFEPWLEFESQKNLFEILSIMKQCWPIHSVLAEFRLYKIVGKNNFQPLLRQGRFAGSLRYWINQL